MVAREKKAKSCSDSISLFKWAYEYVWKYGKNFSKKRLSNHWNRPA